jgi:hypothetical protein
LSPLIVALSDREDARAAHLSIYRFIYLFIYFCLKRNSKKKIAAAALCFGEKQKKRMPNISRIQKLSFF